MARKTALDVSTITIEKSVPMPELKRPGTPWLALISKMEVGDSFVVPNEKIANGLYQYFKKANMKATIREIEAGFCRVWRRA